MEFVAGMSGYVCVKFEADQTVGRWPEFEVAGNFSVSGEGRHDPAKFSIFR